MNLEEARVQFPVLERVAYLNAGTFGPLARQTVEAQERLQREDLERGRAGRAYFDQMQAARAGARAALGRELGVDPEHVALTTSTTDAVNTVLAGLRLEPGAEVVTTDVEHFGLLGPLVAAGADVRVARVRERPAAEAADAILAEVTPRTRLLALSHVAWVTGHVLPLERLKAETGLPLLADGAQSVGAIPVSVGGVDFYTVSGQKWLCGPDSTGGLYVRDVEALHVARPTYFSHDGYEPGGAFTPRAGAARFDSGWIPPGSLAGLVAAIEAAPEWRHARAAEVAARCRELLAERYEVVTEPGHATLVSFRPPREAAAAVASLLERGVVVRELPGTGWVRVSCGYWTSDGDLERLLDGLAA